MDPQFLLLMPHRVLVERKTGADLYGEETYGPATAYPARIRYTQRMVRAADGEEVVARGQVTIGGVSGITADDRITLPAPGSLVAVADPESDETYSPPIVAVTRSSDDVGEHHETVYFA